MEATTHGMAANVTGNSRSLLFVNPVKLVQDWTVFAKARQLLMHRENPDTMKNDVPVANRIAHGGKVLPGVQGAI